MNGFLNIYRRLTLALGAKRGLIRRLAGLAMLAMGVHAAADYMDDALFALLDVMDIALDGVVHAFLLQLSGFHLISPADAINAAQHFSDWIDIEDKEKLSRASALCAEFAADFLLLDLAWGVRKSQPATGSLSTIWQEAREGLIIFVKAFPRFHIKNFFIAPVFIFLAIAGASRAGIALESIFSSYLREYAPRFDWTILVSAHIGVVLISVLLWRFLPELIEGAYRRESEIRNEQRMRLTTKKPASRNVYFSQSLYGLFWGLYFVLLGWQALVEPMGIIALIRRTGAGL
jgi:hypothetical protein